MTLIAGADPVTSFIHIGDTRLLLARDAGFKDWPEFESALLGKPPARRGYAGDAKKVRLLRDLSPQEWDEAAGDVEGIEANGHVTDAMLEQIASLSRVTALNLEGCGHVTDEGLRHLARMPQLRHLNLTGCAITDPGLRVLRNLPDLRSLEIYHHEAITDAGIANLAESSLLERVSLMGTATGDGAIAALTGKPRLRMLMCQDAQATDAGFAALSRSASIEHIWGRNCRKLTRAGFEALSTMPSLRGLAVSCMNLDDQALSALPKFPALREIVPI